ncbi:MAG: Rrf2 family transcriptional regulator [Kiritimatiellae bacterium]|nr:Rrf2 family transcriptional regulator [Kiritimatiellia bacterium]
MKITTKGRYGLRFCVDLALHAVNHPVSLRDASERMGVTEKYLWQVTAPLKSDGIILSSAGSQGGYQLANPASELTTYDVLRSVEGELSLVSCAACSRNNNCATKPFWNGLSEQMADSLRAHSIQRLADEQQKLDLAANPKTSLDYCI